jgi:hypothetical protein
MNNTMRIKGESSIILNLTSVTILRSREHNRSCWQIDARSSRVRPYLACLICQEPSHHRKKSSRAEVKVKKTKLNLRLLASHFFTPPTSCAPAMSGNPNRQKMGKRKGAPAKRQPDWLFPAAGNSSNDNTQDTKPAHNLPQCPPSELIDLVGAFLVDNEFTNTSRSFVTEKKGRGLRESEINDVLSLSTIYNEWRQWKDDKLSATTSANELEPSRKNTKKDAGSSESSSDEDDSDIEMEDAEPAKKHARRKSSPSVSSSSSSDSDADDENETPVVKASSPKAKVNALKRKEHPDSDSSSSESGSDSDSSSESSSEDEAPKAKKAKTEASSSDDSSSDNSSSSSDSDSDSSSKSEVAKAKEIASESSSSGSESSSESGSDSDASTNSIARKVPLPESGSDSTSDSESDSDSDNAANKQNSDTSATLSDQAKQDESSAQSSSGSSSSSSEDTPKIASKAEVAPARKLSPPLPPNPTKKFPRKNNQPFSRIPKDTKVDDRLASNAYVPYDYAERAHQDLIVTKGKGFTKEKNKKKRGSYRGGYIDIEGKKGIKFDD